MPRIDHRNMRLRDNSKELSLGSREESRRFPTHPSKALHAHEDEIRGWSPVINIKVDKNSVYENSTWESAHELFEEMIREYSDKLEADFMLWGSQVKNTSGLDRRRFFKKLEQKGLLLPVVTFFDFPNAETWLAENNLAERVKLFDFNEKNLLVVLDLPVPLQNFWWKEEGAASPFLARLRKGLISFQDITEKELDRITVARNRSDQPVFPWGSLYYDLMPIIHRHIGNPPIGLNVRRINPLYDHKPKKYYYAWIISDDKKE